MNVPTLDEQIEVKNKFKEFVNRNKRGVDKYLTMEYNIAVKKLIEADSDKLRGKLEFIQHMKTFLDL